MRFWVYICLAVAAIALTSCTTPIVSQSAQPNTSSAIQSELKSVTLDKTKIKVGQTIYVPIYSYIYHYDSQKHILNLAATLSIRNTDLKHSIIITAVDYYDTSGKLIRHYLEQPAQLAALASADFFIAKDDVSGGLGANFIVEWAAEQQVFEPIVEAVMISTESGRGISLISSGKVVEHRGMKS
ncbi:MAG: DUF3124 domain-containing protein [Leptolyngbyaceae cyanobacterium RU_5_1]|nr:DUF3124 domain-containing protein [Leptolyngbyaceae cyanobacterium RU_5_1]